MFDDFSIMYIEVAFHLLFEGKTLLIPLKDIFEQYDDSKEKPFTLNILMEVADTDLKKIIKNRQNVPFTIKEFMFLFKGTIQGLIFMHMNKIVHRDIKP